MYNNSLVSIIIPCFNAEATISDAINSALSQSYENKEIIVIDDGSVDDSLSKIKSFGDDIQWETGPNKGGCAARNRGVEIANGEIIQFLDADDLLLPNKLTVQVPILQERGTDIVYCDWETSSPTQKELTAFELDVKKDLFLQLLRSNIQTSAPLHWRRNLLAVGVFRVDLKCAQEYDLHLRLAISGQTMRRVPEVLVEVRRQTQSVSSDYIRVLDQHKNVFENCYNLIVARDELSAKRVFGLAKAFALDAKNYRGMGETDKALSYLQKSIDILQSHPSFFFALLSKLGSASCWLLKTFFFKTAQK